MISLFMQSLLLIIKWEQTHIYHGRSIATKALLKAKQVLPVIN